MQSPRFDRAIVEDFHLLGAAVEGSFTTGHCIEPIHSLDQPDLDVMPLRKRGLGVFQAARDGDTVVIEADVPQVRRAQGDGQAGLGRCRIIPEGRIDGHWR